MEAGTASVLLTLGFDVTTVQLPDTVALTSMFCSSMCISNEASWPVGRAETIRLWVDTSSTAMGARTTSVLKDLEHLNACVGLAGNNLELAGNGKLELQAAGIYSIFSR